MTAYIIWFSLLLLYHSARTLLLTQLAFLILRRETQKKNRRIYHVPYEKGQLRHEWQATYGVIFVDSFIFAGIFATAILPTLSVDLKSFALTLLIMAVWYELWFYVSHRLLHLRPLYFLHKQHHRAKVTSPISATSFSIPERIIYIGGILALPLLLKPWLPLAMDGIVIYGLLNYIGNIMGHINLELRGPQFTRTVWGRWLLNTSTFHALHHSRFNGHYGLFTSIPDKLFGTYYEDYPEIQKMAAKGQGPKTLSYRYHGNG